MIIEQFDPRSLINYILFSFYIHCHLQIQLRQLYADQTENESAENADVHFVYEVSSNPPLDELQIS